MVSDLTHGINILLPYILIHWHCNSKHKHVGTRREKSDGLMLEFYLKEPVILKTGTKFGCFMTRADNSIFGLVNNLIWERDSSFK